MVHNIKECTRCILDTTVPGITFDENGECSYCKLHDRFERKYPLNDDGKAQLTNLVNKISKDGANSKYDCLVGLSGGRDSSFLITWAVDAGLRPLAVFYDSGWYSDQSKENIKRIVSKLNIDLITITCDEEEYRDLQISFLKASTSDIDTPDDQAIITVLYREAAKHKIKYVLSGHSFRTEGNTPLGWSYMDGRYVISVHRIFGKLKLKTYPILSFWELVNYMLIKRIKYVYPLEFVDYHRDKVTEFLSDRYGWVYAGGHHFDCQYIHLITRVLREKFNIDKRKVEYSALIRSGQLTRSEAKEKMKNNPEPESASAVEYSMNRIGLSAVDYEKILQEKPKTFLDYKTYLSVMRLFKIPIMIACKFHIIPMSLYEKYINQSKALLDFYKIHQK